MDNPNIEERRSEQIINLLELEERARELLPQMAYDYCATGANDEVTLRENRTAYERITLLPRHSQKCCRLWAGRLRRFAL